MVVVKEYYIGEKMADQSDLDQKYFIDIYVYNCPFCNRRNVNYDLTEKYNFDWTITKKCYGYLVECSSCNKISMHLSFEDIPTGGRTFKGYRITDDAGELDDKFFYSVPTSFFVVDTRIPTIIRELYSEAEGCLKSNFLTGASACARKIIYELAKLEDAKGEDYESRIKSLKQKKPDIDSTYFDTLFSIQKVTSDKVHENAYDGWNSKHLRLILSSILEILNEIYVIPKIREERRKQIRSMQDEVLGQNLNDNDSTIKS